MSGTQSNNFYRPDIDGLRALAVSLVVYYHAFPDTLKSGFIGVDIFFVISGYLIGSIILRHLSVHKFSFLEFYVRRIVRIFPALLLVLFSVLVAGKFLLFTSEYRMLGKHIAGGAGFVANLVYYFESGYWDLNSSLKLLLHLWSLGVEEQFYIVIPLILAFAWKRKYNLLSIIVVLFILSFCCNLYFYYQKERELIFYMPFTRFWEIFAGVLLAYHSVFSIKFFQIAGQKADRFLCALFNKKSEEHNRICLQNILAILGFSLLIISILICKHRNFPGHRAIWPVLSAVLIISAGQTAWLNKKILSHKILVGIGLISYPLYLWHWPLLSYCKILQGNFLEPNFWLLVRIVCIALAMILAILTYCYVERPVRFGKGNKNRISCILSVLMFAMFITGMYIYYNGHVFYSSNSQSFKVETMTIGKDRDKSILAYAPEAKKLAIARFHNVHSDKTVAVIGDSHAQSAFPGIAERCAQLNMNSVLLKYRFESARDNAEREIVLDILKSKKDIKHVFIFLRGVVYLTGKDHDSGNTNSFIKDFNLLLQDTINTLQGFGKKVHIVSENPVYPVLPLFYLSRQISFKKFISPAHEEYLNQFTVKENVYEHQKDYLSMLQGLEGAEIINGLDVFCPHDACLPYDENQMLLFYDDDHLSVYGSQYLVKNLLEPYLVKIADENDK